MQASLTMCGGHSSLGSAYASHATPQWPSQLCRPRHAVSCDFQSQQRSSKCKQSRSTCYAATQQLSCAMQRLSTQSVPSSSSSSRETVPAQKQQQRAAVVVHSTGNGRGPYNSQDIAAQPATVNTSDRQRRFNARPLPQQQEQYLSLAQQQRLQPEPQSDRLGPKYVRPTARLGSLRQGQQQGQQQYQQYQHQQPQQGYPDGEDGDLIVPRQLFVLRSYNKHIGAWYKAPSYSDPSVLHAAIMQRCGTGSFEGEAVKHLMVIAESPRDAQLALSAVTAVRAVAVSKGIVTPWPDSFVKAFVRMCAECESHEVLLSAMQRPAELGFLFKWKSLLVPLKHWGDQCAVDKLEQIACVMEDAGLRPDERMAYVIVRACVNSGQWDRLDRVLAWFSSKGVHREEFRPAFMRLLEMAERARGSGGSEAAVAAAAAAAEEPPYRMSSQSSTEENA